MGTVFFNVGEVANRASCSVESQEKGSGDSE